MNSYGSYYCVCTNGWTGVNCTIGEFLKAVNMTNPCANDGACMNWYGSYYCVCTNGWTGVNCTIGEFLKAVLLT